LAKNFAHVCAVSACIILYNIYWDSPRWMTQGQDVIFVIATCLYTSLHLFPSLINPQTLQCVYYLQIILAGLLQSFIPQAQMGLWTTVAFACTWRMTCSLAYPGPVAVPFAHVLSSSVSVIVYLYTVELHENLRILVILEVGLCFFVIDMAHSLWESRTSAERQKVVAASLEGQSRALTLLLKLMCDIVVELDRDLCLVEDSPQLSAFFTLGGRRTSLKGSKLQEFMTAEEDRRHFERRLLDPAGSESGVEGRDDLLPGALPVKMRDSMGNILDMELFYVQCDILGDTRFFLGLREQAYEPISQLKHFARQTTRRRRRSRQAGEGGVLGEAEAEQEEAVEGTSANAEENSTVGSSEWEQDLSGSGSGSEADGSAPQQGWLMNPSWRPVEQKGKVLVLIRALEKCNLFVEPTWCCSWHAAVADMKATLRKLEGFECAAGFGVKGAWQCSRCLLAEDSQQDVDRSCSAAAEVCSICAYARSLRCRFTRVSL